MTMLSSQTINLPSERIVGKDAFSSVEMKLFVVGAFLKLSLGVVFASGVVTELFLPFISHFVNEPAVNPYEVFFDRGEGAAFPYPAAMLYILAVPQLLIGNVSGEVSVAALLGLRVILFLADTAILLTLRSWVSENARLRLLLLYWFSPIAIYVNYIHGQLDVIPISFLLLSLFFLFRRNGIASGVLLGVSLASKTSVFLVVPLIFVFLLFRRREISHILLFALSAILSFLILNGPFIGSLGFFEMVFLNAEQYKIFLSYVQLNSLRFYLVPGCWVVLLAFAVYIELNNKDLFLMFTGFTFALVLVLIPPMNGWFYWIIPFFALFYAKERHSSLLLFAIIQLSYFLYFLVSPESDYLQVTDFLIQRNVATGQVYNWLSSNGVDGFVINNLMFTGLQASILLACLQIYLRGIRTYRYHKITGRPFLIGVGGESGVGKSTLTNSITDIFTSENVTTLRGDDRHKWQRGHKKWTEFTHLNPKANHLHQEVNTLRDLAEGRSVRRRMYDHGTGTFTDEFTVKPNRVMILEGLHPFYLDRQRTLFDLKIFVQPEPQLGLHWKICRDKAKRNYTTEQVKAQLAKRSADSKAFIATQQQFADVIVTPKADRAIAEIGEPESFYKVEYEILLRNVFHLEPLVALLGDFENLKVEHEYRDVDYQLLTFSGRCSDEELQFMNDFFAASLREIDVKESAWPESLFSVVLFTIMYCIFEEVEHGK